MAKNGLRFALLALLLIIFTLGWFLGAANVDYSFSDWLNRWQTLIAGIIALAGAGIGAYFLNRQITQDKELEAQRRASKFYAIRSVMPLTLSALMGYVRGEVHVLQNLGPGGELPDELSHLPGDIVEVLKEFIKFADNSEAQSTVRLMLSDIQIHRARLLCDMPRAGQRQTSLAGTYVAGNIVRLTCIYARIFALFGYSRFLIDSVSSKVTFEQMDTAAWNSAVTDTFSVMELIRHGFHIEAGTSGN